MLGLKKEAVSGFFFCFTWNIYCFDVSLETIFPVVNKNVSCETFLEKVSEKIDFWDRTGPIYSRQKNWPFCLRTSERNCQFYYCEEADRLNLNEKPQTKLQLKNFIEVTRKAKNNTEKICKWKHDWISVVFWIMFCVSYMAQQNWKKKKCFRIFPVQMRKIIVF